MKKLLFLAALSSVALTSCVNEELENMETQQALKFDVPALSQTKANVLGEIDGTVYPAAENFVVFCKSYKGAFAGWTNSTYSTDYFAANGEVASNNATVGSTPAEGENTASTGGSKYWATDIVHYWPEAEYNLAFAAYSPAVLTTLPTSIAHTVNGLQIEDFKTESNADNQYDLMYTSRVVDRNKGNNANKAVPLVFKHALSSIVFSAQKADETVDYVITDLKVKGRFHQTGNFNQNITESNNGGYSETENTPTWTVPTETPDTITYDPSFTEFSVPANSPAQFTKGTSALLLIPQVLPADAHIVLTYNKITYTNPNDKTQGSKVMQATANIPLSSFYQDEKDTSTGVSNFEIGTRYVFRISFGQNTRIYFEPSIQNWQQEDTYIHTIL